MARNVVLALGALMWTVLAVSVIALYGVGHWMPPTITIIVGVAWVTMRLIHLRLNRRHLAEAA